MPFFCVAALREKGRPHGDVPAPRGGKAAARWVPEDPVVGPGPGPGAGSGGGRPRSLC